MCSAKIIGSGVIQIYDLPVEWCALRVMGRDWTGRGVYWQMIGKMLAVVWLAACWQR